MRDVKSLRDRYVGKTIRITSCDEWSIVGKTGVVRSVDDMGQLHGSWGGIAISEQYGDRFIVLEEN